MHCIQGGKYDGTTVKGRPNLSEEVVGGALKNLQTFETVISEVYTSDMDNHLR